MQHIAVDSQRRGVAYKNVGPHTEIRPQGGTLDHIRRRWVGDIEVKQMDGHDAPQDRAKVHHVESSGFTCTFGEVRVGREHRVC